MLVPVNVAQTEFVRVLRQLDSDRKKLNDMKAAVWNGGEKNLGRFLFRIDGENRCDLAKSYQFGLKQT